MAATALVNRYQNAERVGRHDLSATEPTIARLGSAAAVVEVLPTPPVLVQTHQALVRKIAWMVHGRMRRSVELADLIQIGMVALLEAAHQFEPRPGATFATYATIRIRGAMIDELRRQANMTRGMLIRRKQLEVARREVSRVTGQPATEPELAAHLGISTEKLARQVHECQGVQYETIDQSYCDYSGLFAVQEENQSDRLVRLDMERVLAKHLRSLPERDAQVLHLYFLEELNLEEIGHILGVGAARVCQIKKVALEKLRALMSPMVD